MRFLTIQATATSVAHKGVSILAYSGGLFRLPNYDLPLVVDLAGMAHPASVPLLADHKNKIDATVGSGSPVIHAGQLRVEGSIVAANAIGESILALAKANVPLQVSIGALPSEIKRVMGGETIAVNGQSIQAPPEGLYLVTKSRLHEVSIVTLGADRQTSAAIAAARKDTAMSFEDWIKSLGLDIATLSDAAKAELKRAFDAANSSNAPLPAGDAVVAAQRAEAQRIEAIDRICTSLAHVPAIVAARGEAIAGRLTNEQLQAMALAEIRGGRTTTPTAFPQQRASIAVPNERNVLTAGLMIRAGFEAAAVRHFGERAVDAARHGPTNLVDLAAASLRSIGHDVPRDRTMMIRAALTSSSLPIILGDSANRIALESYRVAAASWRAFASVKSAANFKTQHSIRPSFGGNLEEIGEGGEIKHGTVDEEDITWSLGTFAKMFAFGRQTIINDDLGVLSEVVPGLARSAMRTLSDLVYTVLLANAGSHFHASNGNLISGGGSALSSAGLTAAIKTLRKMQDAEGNLLDLQPAVLLVSPELETTARALLESTDVQRDVTEDMSPTGNVHKNVATLAVEPRLSSTSFTGSSATQWYLFASIADAPFIVGFLEGAEAPTIESFGLDHDVAKLAFQFRCYHDFGASLGDKRVAIKSAGV